MRIRPKPRSAAVANSPPKAVRQMHKYLLIGVSCLTGTLFAMPVVGQAAKPELDSLVRAEVAQRQFSGVVLLAEQGVPVHQAAVGAATGSARMTIGTRFRLASITKAFTAVLVMQLVEEKRLTSASTIAQVLPDLRITLADRISVQDMLLHRSGLPDESDATYESPRDARTIVTETSANNAYRTYGEFAYSNLDYLVLALMIEKITGKAFGTVLQERILTPLGMDQTGMATRSSQGLAQGYVADSTGALTAEPPIYIENFSAAGAMYGTAMDLLKFDQALYSGRLLKPESISEMYTSHPELGYVAYGSWVYDYYFLKSAPRVVERRGGILGFNHTFIRMPGINKTLIILSNNDRFDPDTFGQLDSFKDKLIKALVESR